MKNTIERQMAVRLIKIVGGFQLVWGSFAFLVHALSWDKVSILIAGGLFMLLFTPERIHDERVKDLKLRAITWGYAWGFLCTLFYQFVRTYPGLKTNLPVFSAFDALIVLTLMALVLFHYWRWQDGRQTPEAGDRKTD